MLNIIKNSYANFIETCKMNKAELVLSESVPSYSDFAALIDKLLVPNE